MSIPPRAIVTRPEREATQWVQDLRAQGITAQALPLLGIGALRQPHLRQALQQARQQAQGPQPRWQALMFVSPNAVRHFFQDFEQNSAIPSASPWGAAINFEAWAPGPGTAQALREAAVPARRIIAPAPGSVQFDSEALWPLVAQRLAPGARVLIVRGSDGSEQAGGQGRQWLAQRLESHGVAVDCVAAYERCAAQLSASALALAHSAASDGSVWLLSSSEALAQLGLALPGQSWQQARALATHERIAQAAQAAGFGQVAQCRPTLADVVASIKSHHAR